MERKQKDLKGLEATISQYESCLRGTCGDDSSNSEAKGAMAITPVADDALPASATSEP